MIYLKEQSYIQKKMGEHKVTVFEDKEKERIAAEKAELKRQQKIDQILTPMFNKLCNDLDITVEALKTRKGKIDRNVGGANTFSQFLKQGLGLTATIANEFSSEDLERNKSFQRYKKVLEEQGYELDISKVKAAETTEIIRRKIQTVYRPALAVASVFLPVPFLNGVLCTYFSAKSLSALAMSNEASANFELKIKEKQPMLLLEYKPETAQSIASTLLNDLNKQPEAVAATAQQTQSGSITNRKLIR